jgi:2-keto-3-deoxy-L-rhamnonate aldolase RhmA
VGVGRAHRYGQNFRTYVDTANEYTTLIVQIEHIQAVQNLIAILDVPGIDGVLVGPFDLSASMGKPGFTNDPEVQAAIQQVLHVCQERSKPCGIFMGDAEGGRWALEQGFHMVACASDTLLLTKAFSELLTTLKAK